MAANTPSNASGEDTWLIVVAGCAMLLLVVWLVAGRHLAAGAWTVLRAEAHAVSVAAPWMSEATRRDFHEWQSALAKPMPDALASADTFFAALTYGGKWIRWPMLALVLVLTLFAMRRQPQHKYCRVMDMEGLLRERAVTHPRIRPVLWLEGKEGNARGPYTPPLSPFAWAVHHGAVVRESGDKLIGEDDFRPAEAERAFAAQLGRQVPTATVAEFLCSLRFYERILALVFMARICNRDDLANALLDDAAAGFGPEWTWGRRVWQSVRGRSLLDWPLDGPWRIRLSRAGERSIQLLEAMMDAGSANAALVQGVIAGHCHVRTALSALLEAAQRTGIVTSSDFIWLKAVDRGLHYAMNDTGRRVTSAEAAGVRAHLQAELEAGEALSRPTIDAAVVALRVSLAADSWEPPTGFR